MKIGQEKDILVRLGHMMHFPNDDIEIRIENTGEVVKSRKDLVEKVVLGGLLDE